MTEKNQLKKDYFWNTLGGVADSASSVIYLLLVTQLLGVDDGGIFALAYAMAQQFLTIGLYDTRTFQATDTEEVYSFGIYLSSRLLTCLVMMICVTGYAFVAGGVTWVTVIFVLVGLMKVFDALEDVFQGFLQQHNRLDLAGRAKFGRVMLSMLGFFIALILWRNLLFGCVVAIGCSTIMLIWLDVLPVRRRNSVVPQFQWKGIRSLLIACFPLFVGGFLYTYLSTAPRLGIETYLNDADQAYFAIIFMPAMLINLASTIVFRPLLTAMADHWNQNRKPLLLRFVARGSFFALVITAVVIGLAIPFGPPVLSWLYGVDVNPYLIPLIIILGGGGLNAITIIMYYALVIMRHQASVMIGYVIAAASVTALTFTLIPFLSILGAAWAYLIGMGVLVLVFGWLTFHYGLRHIREDSGETAAPSQNG